MWSKVHDMHAQQRRDRQLRLLVWLIEFVMLILSIFVCMRVGAPDVICPDLDRAPDSGMVSPFALPLSSSLAPRMHTHTW